MKSSTIRQSPRRRKAPSASRRLSPDPVYHEVRPALYDLSRRAPRLTRASAGDHSAIHQLLLAVFQGPSAAEFQAQQDEPFYEPTDRLVVKCGSVIAAHLRLTKRTLRFGPLQLPAVGFMDLATAPEYRGQGFASAMLAAAERVATHEGAVLGVTRTRVPSLFAQRGWGVCGRHEFSTASARRILAQLCDKPPPRGDSSSNGAMLPPLLASPQRKEFQIRPLRRIELPAVIGLYNSRALGTFGWPVRSEAYWDWLLHRGAFDAAFVAAEGQDRFDISQPPPAIAGYAFVKEGRIVELLASLNAEGEGIPERLLTRVCRDALERNVSEVRIDAAASNPLHALFAAAGGQLTRKEEHEGEVFMAKLFDPPAFLRSLAPLVIERAKAAGLSIPLRLGMCLENDGGIAAGEATLCRLVVTSRSVKIEPGPPGRSYLALRRRDLTPLLLGHWRLPDAVALGRIRATTHIAEQTAAALFPQLPWWRPPLDELVA